jgi:hypothetical protein
MVRFAFSNGGRLKEAHDGTWWVMHTSNDSILAYCSTKEEAEETRRCLGALDMMFFVLGNSTGRGRKAT